MTHRILPDKRSPLLLMVVLVYHFPHSTTTLQLIYFANYFNTISFDEELRRPSTSSEQAVT